MPGVDLDTSAQLDEILSELLNDKSSSSKDPKLWNNDTLGQQSGSITTQSGNSRTIISWQTNQAGPKKLVTATKQLTGTTSSNWNGEFGSNAAMTKSSAEGMNSDWKSEKIFGGETSSVYQYRKSEERSETLKRENAMNSSSSHQWNEDGSSTIGKVAKTPPTPPVRKRLTNVDELRMGLLGSSTESKAESKGEDTVEIDLTRKCTSDTEETRDWLDEQIWKLQAKKSGKSYQQHSRLEKQLIADLKNRLGLGGNSIQSDAEERHITITSEKKASLSAPSVEERRITVTSEKKPSALNLPTEDRFITISSEKKASSTVPSVENRLTPVPSEMKASTSVPSVENRLTPVSSEKKATSPSPPQRSRNTQGHVISRSCDDVTGTKAIPGPVKNIVLELDQTDSADELNLLTSSRKIEVPDIVVKAKLAPALKESSSIIVQKTTSHEELSQSTKDKSTLKRQPVRSLSLGDDDPTKPSYKTKASFYVSGIERPAFSTHQTKYTFSVNPLLLEDPQNNSRLPPVPPPRSSAPTSPLAPKRGESSREALLKSQRKLVCSPTLDELENSLRLIMEQQPRTQASVPEKGVADQRKLTTPLIDDEVIVLKPIGPGIQTLEPDKIGTLRRPMTPLIPMSVTGTLERTQSRGPVVSPFWASTDNVNSSQQGPFSQQSQVSSAQYSSETLQKNQIQQNVPVYETQQPPGIVTQQSQPWQNQQTLQRQLQTQQWQQQQPYQPQQPWQQPLSMQQHVSWQLQSQGQPWQHQQQQQQTWQQQQSWTMQQQQPPQIQQAYVSGNTLPPGALFIQNPAMVQARTTEITQQRNDQHNPALDILQRNVQPQPVSVTLLNNEQFDNIGPEHGNSLINRQQNQEVFVQNTAQQGIHQQNKQFNSHQFDVQQYSHQTLNNQQMGRGGQSTMQNQHSVGGGGGKNQFYEQIVRIQQTNHGNGQVLGDGGGGQVGQPSTNQLVSDQQSNIQKMQVYNNNNYNNAPQFSVGQQGAQYGGMHQENARYVTVEQTASQFNRNGTLQQNGFYSTNNNVPGSILSPQAISTTTNAPNQGQLMQQHFEMQQGHQQQVQQQQQQYSRMFQSSSSEQVHNERQATGVGAEAFHGRTISPVPLGSPSSLASWPSVGNDETLRSQTLQMKRSDANPQSQSKSYETLMRTRSPSLMRAASPASIYNGQFRNGSLTSLTDGAEFANTMPRFVRDTSKYWHKPHISREEAINLLKDKPPGSFVVRNSTTFQGGFGLALKVAQLPPNVQAKGDDPQANLVRHFLIESTSKGVRLKGCSNEPVFGSLAALIYQHSITPLALPCKLLLPTADVFQFDETDRTDVNATLQSSANNTLYVDSVDTESLTGPEALSKAIEFVFGSGTIPSPKATPVQFKISVDGITLTDNKHRLFFRRHYPLNTVSFCGVDGKNRKLTLNGDDSGTVSGKLFGFVARKSGGSNDNICHIFLDTDNSQLASSIVDVVTRVMMDQGQLIKT